MIKLDTSLDGLADKLENVQWHGEYFSSACAFHDTVSGAPMMVYHDGYNCLSCGAHGSIEKLAQRLNSTNAFIVHAPEAGHETPQWYRWLKTFGTWEHLVDVAHDTVLSNSKLGTYFINRGIGDYVEICHLGYLDGWYVFPVYDRYHELQTVVVRSGPSKKTDSKYVLKPKDETDEKNYLYIPDWSVVSEYSDLYIPFGIVDSISLRKIGLSTATGTTGKAINPTLLDEFRAPIWVIPDRGEDREATALYSRLGWRGRLLRLAYPEDCKDSNDVLCKYGSSVLTQLIADAKEACTQTLHQKEH